VIIFNNKCLVEPNQKNLKGYYSIVRRSDNNEPIKNGDYVTLKSYPFINSKYGGCVLIGTSGESEKHYGYVMDIKQNDSNGHVLLGSLLDMKLAVIADGEVRITTCDSRMFCKAEPYDVPVIIKEVKERMLVRP